ncbi:hypothetical protein [Primorskyibacter flagellatus]|uniref:hypothetical protein n=1 Tax=Primorskyibacter flagellatus TaxID=1387277 RepID=UPI003A8D77C2
MDKGARDRLFTRKLTRISAESLVLMLVILLVGLIASLISPAEDWFARSGSVVVLLAIVQIFRWRIIYRNQMSWIALSEALVNGFGEMKIRRKKPELSTEEAKAMAQTHAQNSYSTARSEMSTEEAVFWLVEAALLSIGTMVWGFGDLPFKLGCAQC